MQCERINKLSYLIYLILSTEYKRNDLLAYTHYTRKRAVGKAATAETLAMAGSPGKKQQQQA